MTGNPCHMLSQPLLCIVGPTASGKSALAQKVAEQLGASILSADSMQIYTGMDIGTGKVPKEQRSVPYYGLDITEPDSPYSAQRYQEYGRTVVEQLDDKGSLCIVCGGTGFYIRALIDDYRFPAGEQVGNTVRDTYMVLADEKGSAAVWEYLDSVDPASAAVIDPHDVKRVVRALEMYEDGTSYAEQKEALRSIPCYYPAVLVGLAVDPDILRKRIDRRVYAMMEQGFEQEVETLLEHGLRDALTSSVAIGYRELIDVFDGVCSRDEAVASIMVATHQYAKRQRTWFRKDSRIHWLDANEIDRPEVLDELVAQTCLLYDMARSMYRSNA